MDGFHDDPAHRGLRVLGRHQQIHMPEDATPRLVQHEIPECTVLVDPLSLFPQRLAGRRTDAPDDHVTHLACGVAPHHVNYLFRSHLASAKWPRPSCASNTSK